MGNLIIEAVVVRSFLQLYPRTAFGLCGLDLVRLAQSILSFREKIFMMLKT